MLLAAFRKDVPRLRCYSFRPPPGGMGAPAPGRQLPVPVAPTALAARPWG